MFNGKLFLENYNIPNVTEGPDCSPGYVNIKCPMCDDPLHHGGFNIKKEFYSCWKCGWHPIEKIIETLLDVSRKEARVILKHYTNQQSTQQSTEEQKEKDATPTSIHIPKEAIQPLPDKHRKYLIKRKFDPDKLVKEYNLYGTNHLGYYKNRIIAPIYYNQKLISYQGRDITNQQTLRYKACKKINEVIHHKHIPYNIDKVTNRRAIIVEGITDVWRLGPGSIATFGTGWTREQLTILIEKLNTLFILFDQDAEQSAEELATNFSSFSGKEAVIIDIDYKDPATMPQDEADNLMRDIKF